MASKTVGPLNGNWKGGRSIASTGYVLIRVGVRHHLADVRGYAYEHRLVAEKKLGRPLKPGEQVHHIDGNKQNNDPDNIEVMPSIAHHRFKERKKESNRRTPGASNVGVFCECGCKKMFTLYDSTGRPRRFVSGHNRRGQSGRYKN